jgi:hypothetical protein
VRQGRASAFKMLRDITFIQLGQLIVALMGGRLRAHRSPGGDVAGEPVSSPHLFALRIALRVRHIVAGMGFRVTMAKSQMAADSASASAILQVLKVGVTPVLLGTAFVRMNSLLEPAAHAAPTAPAAYAASRLLSLVHDALHLVIVDKSTCCSSTSLASSTSLPSPAAWCARSQAKHRPAPV